MAARVQAEPVRKQKAELAELEARENLTASERAEIRRHGAEIAARDAIRGIYAIDARTGERLPPPDFDEGEG